MCLSALALSQSLYINSPRHECEVSLPSISRVLGEILYSSLILIGSPSISRILAVRQLFHSYYSFLTSTTKLYHNFNMSHNGEASSSNATRPTISTDDLQGLSDEQKQTVERCTGIVQEFRTGQISKSRAALLLQQTIPHDDFNDEEFLSIYEPYFDMLENFERYRRGNVQQTDEIQRRLDATPDVEHDPHTFDEQPDEAVIARASKRQRSLSTDGPDDEYTRRTRLNFSALPWNEEEGAGQDRSSTLSPALQKTQSLLENFSRDVKRARSSLLNCNKSIPQFPQTEWLNLLNGYAVDLDHVFSNIYTIPHNTNDDVELGKNLEILQGSSLPAKTVKTHGDWVIAWDCLVDATLFVFKHRRRELLSYGKHIQRYFASLSPQYHNRVINYDRAVRIRAAQRRDIELTDFNEFADLQIQWISNPSTVSFNQSSDSRDSREPKAKSSNNRRRSAACRRWNEGRCPNSAASCNYMHICAKCSSSEHVANKCNSPGKK